MSRGHGCLQRYLFEVLAHKPMTFAEIRKVAACEGYPTVERSLRRSLRKMVDDKTVVTTGRGGPGDPSRYEISPLLHFFAGEGVEDKAALGRAFLQSYSLEDLERAMADLPK